MKQIWMKSIKVSRNPVSGLLDWSDQKANRLFLLLFEEKTVRTRHTGYFPPNAEIKDYNIMIDNRTFFGHLVKNYIRAYDNIWKTATGQRGDYRIGCLLHYRCFKENYKLISINLSK